MVDLIPVDKIVVQRDRSPGSIDVEIFGYVFVRRILDQIDEFILDTDAPLVDVVQSDLFGLNICNLVKFGLADSENICQILASVEFMAFQVILEKRSRSLNGLVT